MFIYAKIAKKAEPPKNEQKTRTEKNDKRLKDKSTNVNLARTPGLFCWLAVLLRVIWRLTVVNAYVAVLDVVVNG